MDSEHPEPLATASFEVEYQRLGRAVNEDLSERGTLTIESTEPRYRFTGRPRSRFDRATEVKLESAQIWNAVADGNCVQFETRVGNTGQTGRPFIFFCATPAEAARAVELLPRFQERDFAGRRAFEQQLADLPAASSAWTTVTVSLISANLLAFVVMGLFGAGWLMPDDMRPYVLFAANNAGATTDGEWWRLLTSMFVHYGLIHLLLNMWALFQLGQLVERLLGRPLFAVGYFGSGIVAGFVSMRWHGDAVWSAGASGAVFGLYGLLFGFMLREKRAIPSVVLQPLLKSTLLFAGYNLLYGFVQPQIDNAAHIGGLLGGLVFGWLAALPLDHEARTRHERSRLKATLSALALLIAVGVAAAPRFDYRFREELAWGDTIEAFGREETAIDERQQAFFADYAQQPPTNADELLAWVRGEAVPFYERTAAKLRAIALTPGKLTARQRDEAVGQIEAKLIAYRELADAVAQNEGGALRRFNETRK